MSEAPPETRSAPIETDAVVIGAGPVGLFQVFELGLLEVACHLVDALPHAGGQCVELYADKPIYDIPAMAIGTGRELTDRLLRQIEPFATPMHLGQQISVLRPLDDGRFHLETTTGTRFLAKAVVIAGGVGAFVPRRLRLDGLDRFEGTQLLYRVDDASALAGRSVVVVGGEAAAVELALSLAQVSPADAQGPRVTLMHRREELKAPADQLARVKALREAGALQFIVGQVTGIEAPADRLKRIEVIGADGDSRLMPLDVLVVQQGLSPRLGPIADWSLAMERKQLVVDTATFETSVAGVFAVGDVNTYPGKRKLIVCGFHEATLAAYAVAAHVAPDRPVPFQYTTTSPRLHTLLGVRPAVGRD